MALVAPQNAATLLPKQARQDIFRSNRYYGPTCGFCLGYVQANLVVLPAQFADEFEEFCNKNSSALPLLYRSKAGELTASPLADNSNISTDIPRYVIYSHGKQVHDMLDLSGFDWNDKVSFYLGCSFSFEYDLLTAGIQLHYIQENVPVPMYQTNIICCSVNGKFTDTKMIVSMRCIKCEQLQTVVSITSCYPSSHGAPIHVGDPHKIGISDINTTITNDIVTIQDNEIPVFWACGVTGKKAMETLGADLSFTHYPGSMFICDLKSESIKKEPSSDQETQEIVQVSPSRLPYFASLLSTKALDKLRKLEMLIIDDPSQCGIKELREDGDFIKSVLILSHATSVGIIFGFPCNINCTNLEETDGPPGAFSIAQSLQVLGKKVFIISEERNKELVEHCIKYLTSKGALMSSSVEYVSCNKLIHQYKEIDCLIAIERVGESEDGSHYTSSGIDVTQYLEPIDCIFSDIQVNNIPLVTIGIGDRGNELGLGKVREKVKAVMKDGSRLGCNISSDYVILAGVSNWGGYGISTGLYVLANCLVHCRYITHGVNTLDYQKHKSIDQFLPTNEQTIGLLKLLNQLGVCDGISKSLNQSVDGLPLQVHLDKLEKLREIAK